jgi:hypothetical protein
MRDQASTEFDRFLMKTFITMLGPRD